MSEFTKVEDTLFVPMLGRIYCSERFPHILNDRKALEISKIIPADLLTHAKGNQYTHIASAVRSTNMDRYIQDFMKRSPDGVIVQIGCGLETTFFRNDDGKHHWIELDLPEVIAFRKKILGESERDTCLVADATTEEWIKKVRERYPTQPLLVTSSGVFYYFTEEMVLGLMKNMAKYGNAELVFDAVNGTGIRMMHRLMKIVGHAEAAIYFYVDDSNDLAKKVGAEVVADEKYYRHISRKGLSLMTKISMRVADRFSLVRMLHLRFR